MELLLKGQRKGIARSIEFLVCQRLGIGIYGDAIRKSVYDRCKMLADGDIQQSGLHMISSSRQ